MERQSSGKRSVTETTESSDDESWETYETYEEDSLGSYRRAIVGPDIVPKTIPAPDGMYKVVCLSFLDEGATVPVAANAFEESWRMLAPGGLLYVVDNRAVVARVPKMRQMLSRVVQPSARLKSHDTRTRKILEANGFDTDLNVFASNKVVRWKATKPLP
jgi:hypothetical protein